MSKEEYIKQIKSNKETLYATRCNWCTKEANQFGTLGIENLVPIKGKTFNGEQAVALYCASCLERPERVNDPKKAFIMENGKPTELGFNYLQGEFVPENRFDPEPENEPDKELRKTLEPKVQESETQDRLLPQKDNIEGEIKTGTSAGTEIEPKIVEDNKDGVETEKKKKGIFG
jgi:hypothetical protein